MTTKRFMRFQIILLILLAISLVGNTFSWATRPAVMGGGFMGTAENDFIAAKLETPDYYLNGNSCTAVTYKGTLNEATGKITYDETNPITYFEDSERADKAGDGLQKGEVHYFKTVITNTSTVPTTVSLYINGQYYNNTPVLYGVSSPVTTRDGFIATINQKNNYFEFAPIVTHFEVNSATSNGNGTSNVEWYIFYNENSTATVDMSEIVISDIILTNN